MVIAFRSTGMALLFALPLVAFPAMAARRLGPPSEALIAPENRVAVVRVLELGEGAISVEPLVELHGETDGELKLRLAAGIVDGVEKGATYVVGYSLLTRDPRGRSRDYVVDPRGPGVIEVPAIGTALFPDTRSLRALIVEVGRDRPDPARLVAAILSQLESAEGAGRTLAALELALRPSLLGLLGRGAGERLRPIVAGAEAPAASHLLRALRPKAGEPGWEWLADAARRRVDAADRRLELASPAPALLLSAIELLGVAGGPGDAARLADHLESNNPAVGRAAFDAILRLAPEEAAAAAARSLAAAELHPDVATHMERYLASASGR